MIRFIILILILLNSCSQNDKNIVSKSVDFSNFYNLSNDQYKKKLEDYNKSKNLSNNEKLNLNLQ